MSIRQASQAMRLFARHFPDAVGWSMAAFAGFNLFGEIVRPGFDASLLWMPLRPYPWWASRALLGATTFLLFWSLMRPAQSAWRYVLTQTLLLFLALSAGLDGALYYRRLASKEIQSAIPFPFAWLVALTLGTQIWRIRRGAGFQPSPQRVESSMPGGAAPTSTRVSATAAGIAAVVALFLLGQFFLFGQTAHLQEADCIIVMGAGVLPDGTPSRSLRDRTRRGCQLYFAGFSRHLIFSGGPSGGGVTEPEAMMTIARQLGVPSRACIRDELGTSTYRTAISTRRIMKQRGWRTALVVSHDYHLSRTWLAFHRAGVTVYTVPAKRSRLVIHDAYSILREMAAWLYYYPRPLWEPFRTS